MPFRFVYLCDLLDELERIATKSYGPTLLSSVAAKRTNDAIIQWFKQHRQRINAFDTDGDAITRSLWLLRDSGRVYGLDPKRLEHVIARALALPTQKWIELQKWECSHRDGDLAACVERVMRNISDTAVPMQVNEVTIEEIDQALLGIASHQKSSSPEVRALATSYKDFDPSEALGSMYRRLQSREAKWLTRLILKNYSPVKIPDVLDDGNPYLPSVLCTRIEVPNSRPVAVRREGTGIVRGLSSAEPLVGNGEGTLRNRRQPPPSSSITLLESSQQQPPRQSAPRSALQPISSNIIWSQPTPASPAALLPIPPSSNRHIIKGTGICTLTQNACPLENCIFLLGPCLSSVPWVTENLLPFHSSTFITSPHALFPASLPRHNPRTGKKYRKIVLVEANRPTQAVAFLKKIKALNLKRRDGAKEWVEAYDWRLLECIAKVDQGKALDYNPWKRCWMGAV